WSGVAQRGGFGPVGGTWAVPPARPGIRWQSSDFARNVSGRATVHPMARGASARVNVILDEERSLKLQRLAERTNVNPGTLARSLLSTALDEADPEPRDVTALLDAIDGAWERAQRGREEDSRGEGIPLEDL